MILMPVYGRLSDGVGRRRLLLAGMLIFVCSRHSNNGLDNRVDLVYVEAGDSGSWYGGHYASRNGNHFLDF